MLGDPTMKTWKKKTVMLKLFGSEVQKM